MLHFLYPATGPSSSCMAHYSDSQDNPRYTIYAVRELARSSFETLLPHEFSTFDNLRTMAYLLIYIEGG
jgi:hypothetical protein